MNLNRFLAIALTISLAGPLAAADPTALGKYKDWSVFTDGTGSSKLCYAATPANDKAPRAADHGDVWLYVTTWQSGSATDQPSIKVGYDLHPTQAPRLKVGRSSWGMYAANREAFADDSDDARIVSALKQGSSVRVEAVSARNTQVTYQFSLSGSSAAIDKARNACR